MNENTDATEGTATLVVVSPPSMPGELPRGSRSCRLPSRTRFGSWCARASGASLTGPSGLLKQLTKMVVEAALDKEMSEHVGYDKGDQAGRMRANSRNGKRTKTVITDDPGPVEIVVPQDREGTFESVIVPSTTAALILVVIGVSRVSKLRAGAMLRV